NAVREGARLAISNTNNMSTAAIQSQVTSYLSGQQLNNLSITVFKADANGNSSGVWTDAAFGERIGVQLDATYTPLLPNMGILPNPITLHSRAVMRSEAN